MVLFWGSLYDNGCPVNEKDIYKILQEGSAGDGQELKICSVELTLNAHLSLEVTVLACGASEGRNPNWWKVQLKHVRLFSNIIYPFPLQYDHPWDISQSSLNFCWRSPLENFVQSARTSNKRRSAAQFHSRIDSLTALHAMVRESILFFFPILLAEHEDKEKNCTWVYGYLNIHIANHFPKCYPSGLRVLHSSTEAGC